MAMLNTLEAVGSIDGRYQKDTASLRPYFSERGLIEKRVVMETDYLKALSNHPEVTHVRPLKPEEVAKLDSLKNVSLEDAEMIKAIEVKGGYRDINNGNKTEHDVKAVEYFIKDKLKGTSLADVAESTHFALTSEDTSNIAYALLISDALGNVIIPTLEKVAGKLEEYGEKYAASPMLARTHGQPALGTTVGKEFKVTAATLRKQSAELKNYKISVKLDGADGNYNAHIAAYPNVDWLKFSVDFIESYNTPDRMIKLEPNLITTQIEPHDTYSKLLDMVARINNTLIKFDDDTWRYISDNWIVQIPKEGEVGSSTMPQKVNPINFENSFGNLLISSGLCQTLSRELPRRKLQRDLSDSTMERVFGTTFGHGLIGYQNILKGFEKIKINEEEMLNVLKAHPETIGEAIQTILRREGVSSGYERLKDFTRGKKVTLDDMHAFIETLAVSQEVKEELKRITPENYIGLAPQLAVLDQEKYLREYHERKAAKEAQKLT